MAYFNPYFEDRSGNIESAPTYTFEQFLDLKPPSYFLALLRHNYIWTKRENLDTFSFRVSPSFIFWHDRLLDIYPPEDLRDFLFEIMGRAGLMNEPVMIMVEWARTIAEHKIKRFKTRIDSKDESDAEIYAIPEDKLEREQIWNSNFIEDDKKMFSTKFDVADKLYQVREVPGVLQENPKAPVRWLRFLVMNPKEIEN